MHDIKANFDIILEKLKFLFSATLTQQGNLKRRGSLPQFSDIEVVSLNLTAEYLSIDSENLLFKKLKTDYKTHFPHLISRSQYNPTPSIVRRKRGLFAFIEEVRKKLVAPFLSFENVFITDSKPLPICAEVRANESRICREKYEALPTWGYCAAKKMYYWGYKLHTTHTFSGVIAHLDLSAANVHDVHYLQDIEQQISACLLIGDKGYLNKKRKKELWEKRQILVYTGKRSNQTCFSEDEKGHISLFETIRKGVERTYSQLKDQFLIERNYAKTFWGFKTRILSKITALTLIQYFNNFVIFRDINLIKSPIY